MQTAIYMKGIGLMIKRMESEFIYISMGHDMKEQY